MKKIIHFFIISLVLLSFGCADAQKAGLYEGNKFENFSAVDLDGKEVALNDVIGNGPVLLVFFATWCPPCREEVPHLIKLNDQYKGQGLTVLATSVDNSSRVLPGFIKKNNISYTVWHDTKKMGSAAYQIQGIPTNILIDKMGIIQFRAHHLPTQKEIESLLES